MSLRKLNAVCNTGGGEPPSRGEAGKGRNGARHHAPPPYFEKKKMYTQGREILKLKPECARIRFTNWKKHLLSTKLMRLRSFVLRMRCGRQMG